MKSKLMFYTLILTTVLLIGSIGCAGKAVSEQKQIATACASITAAGNVIAAAAETDPKWKPLAAKAYTAAEPTKSFCQPKPADHLSPVDYALLLSAAAELATMKESVR